MPHKNGIYVTQPLMPPLDDFIPYLRRIWDNKWLTNSGPFHQEFEHALADYLGVEHVALVANGTTALSLALKALRVGGEVITTPFSFVATSHALLGEGVRPVFVDIDPVTCNLDPDAIEAAITPRTTAIMPVHCYGHPCDVERIAEIAERHDLDVIYDAAHAFGVKYKGESLMRHGNASTLSFHATKVFNTFEGGAVVCRDAKTKQRIDRLKNFGFAGDVSVAVGGNSKLNEVQSAFGLLQLNHIDAALARRRAIAGAYHSGLSVIAGISTFGSFPDTELNASYMPILVGDDYPLRRDALHDRLHGLGIHSRRYFSPLISDMVMYRSIPSARSAMPVARRLADQILCLPIYPELPLEVVTNTIAAIADPAMNCVDAVLKNGHRSLPMAMRGGGR